MRARVKLFFSIYLYWVLIFVFNKALFLLYHWDKSSELPFSDWLRVLFFGARMDLAMAGYFLALVGLILVFTVKINTKPVAKWINGFVFFTTLISCLLAVTDMELYFHWGFKLDISPLLYLSNDAEAAASTGNNWIPIRQALYGIGLTLVYFYAYYRWIGSSIKEISTSNLRTAIGVFFLTALLFIPIRSSFGDTPLNAGFVYFHKSNLFANHAAINVVWNFLNSLNVKNEITTPNLFPSESIATYTDPLFANSGASERLHELDKPNFVVIIMENFNARFVETLGGKPGLTPNFENLIKEGVLFKNFYANGHRTEQGIMAVINGWPPYPTQQLIKFPRVTERLPYINKSFKRNGYQTSYTSGYSHFFANFSSYLGNAQFDNVTSKEDYDASIPTGVWGVHDYYIFERLIEDINDLEAPFLQVGVSQSNHEPFDAPMTLYYEGEEEDMEIKFHNSMRYADESLGMFIEKAKQQPWWDNTIIAITADHCNGWVLPEYRKEEDSNNRVPLLLLGGALTKRDTIISTYGSQNDIAKTLLGQIGDPAPEFKFGKDLLAPSPQSFAYYTFNNGFGYARDSVVMLYSNDAKKYLKNKGPSTKEEQEQGKAWMQMYFNEVAKMKK